MSYKRSRLARSWLRSFLSFVFSRCGRFISRKIIPFCLCFVVLGLSLTVPSYAAAETTYNIRDFQVTAFTLGNSGDDYSSTVTYTDYSYGGVTFTRVGNSNSNFYSSENSKNEFFFNLTNLNLKDEYNLSFTYNMFAAVGYSLGVYLLDSSDQAIATFYEDEVSSSNASGNRVCNVNFTLNQLGVSSNTGLKLAILLIVPSGYSFNFKLGFSEITLINLDDDTGLLESILNWLSRIYHSIAGGTDREGVTHTGIVQGIVNALTNVKNAIVNAIDGIEQWFIDLKDNIVDGLKSLFIPRDGYFAEKKTQLETFATEHFGALYQGPDVMIDLIRKLLTVDPSANPGITMPAIEFDFQGQHYTLTEAIHYSFSWVNDSSHPLYYFYHIYRGFVTVILFVGFGNYLVKKYRDVFEGGGDGE